MVSLPALLQPTGSPQVTQPQAMTRTPEPIAPPRVIARSAATTAPNIQAIERGRAVAKQLIENPGCNRATKIEIIITNPTLDAFTKKVAIDKLLDHFHDEDKTYINEAARLWQQVVDTAADTKLEINERIKIITKLFGDPRSHPRLFTQNLINKQEEINITNEHKNELGVLYHERLIQKHKKLRTRLLGYAHMQLAALENDPLRVRVITELRKTPNLEHQLKSASAEFLTDNLHSYQKKLRNKIDDNNIHRISAALSRLEQQEENRPFAISDYIPISRRGSLGRDAALEILVIINENTAAIPVHIELCENGHDNTFDRPNDSKVLISIREIKEAESLHKMLAAKLQHYKQPSTRLNQQELNLLLDKLTTEGGEVAKRAVHLLTKLKTALENNEIWGAIASCSQEINHYTQQLTKFNETQSRYMEELLRAQATMPAKIGVNWFLDQYSLALETKIQILKDVRSQVKAANLNSLFEAIAKVPRMKFEKTPNNKTVLNLSEYYSPRSLEFKIQTSSEDLNEYRKRKL